MAAQKHMQLPNDAAIAQYRGQLIAVLMQGEKAGSVIAHVPREFGSPVQRREEIARQVDQSQYKGQRYVIHELLPSVFTEEE